MIRYFTYLSSRTSQLTISQGKSGEEGSDAGSQEVESDYDEEDENDYEDNYFDNGEEDNLDDMGGGLGNDNAGEHPN